MDVLREKNRELQAQVQELDLQLFQSLIKPIHNRLINHFDRNNEQKLKMEPDDEQFEDAREEASHNTTDSEDKHSSIDHDVLSLPHQEDLKNSSFIANQEDIRRLVLLYEKQFEKMKVQLPNSTVLTDS